MMQPTPPPDQRGDPSDRDLDAMLAAGARVLWCAPHPDDEFMFGAILARASLFHGCAVRALILTRGDGGETAIDLGGESLGDVRAREMVKAAENLGLELVHHALWNAPLPADSFPDLPELYARWCADPSLEGTSPVDLVAQHILDFRPDILLTFDPHHGATGHPEHRLAARIATAAARRAARADRGHTTPRMYYALKRHWLFRLFRDADPGPVDEVFDGNLPARAGESCMDVLCATTLCHQTQARDMRAFRRFRRLFTRTGLRRVDYLADDAPLPPDPQAP